MWEVSTLDGHTYMHSNGFTGKLSTLRIHFWTSLLGGILLIALLVF